MGRATAWRLFNATTFALAGRIVENASVTPKLHQIIDGVCEASTEEGEMDGDIFTRAGNRRACTPWPALPSSIGYPVGTSSERTTTMIGVDRMVARCQSVS